MLHIDFQQKVQDYVVSIGPYRQFQGFVMLVLLVYNL